MNEPVNGFDLLDQLRKDTGKQTHSFEKLGNFIGLKARERGIPVGGEFELTPLCNLSCKMCYVHLEESQLDGCSILSVETWKSLMHQAWEAGMISAVLTGGECLTYPGFDELYLYLHSLGCQVSVLTNGLLLTEKRIDFFRKHMPESIQVTLYGWNNDVYEKVTGKPAFSTVKENFIHASNAGLPIYFGITPNKYMGEDLLETIRVAKALSKVTYLNSGLNSPREETGRSENRDNIDTSLYIRALRYRNELNGRKNIEIPEENLPPCGGPSHETNKCGLVCGGGRSSFAIDWKGVMMPCINFQMIQAYPLVEGFSTAWRKVNQASNQWPRVPECEGCAYNIVCNYCVLNMLQYAEPGKVPTALCEQTKEMVRNGVLLLPECARNE